MKKRLLLYSPIKPARTGTANYFELLLHQLNGRRMGDYEVILVIDTRFYTNMNNLQHHDYMVMEYGEVEARVDDIRIYLLANNEYHRYVHRALYLHTPAAGMAISVIHEPSMWMNIEAMCNNREYGFSETDLEYFANYEFGEDTKFICALAARGMTDDNFRYSSLAGRHIYENSDVIVFHSRFAKAKFLAERSSTYVPARKNYLKTLVMEHPPEIRGDLVKTPLQKKKKNTFIVGIYGWVKKVKQAEEVIQAFGEFYDSLSAEEKTNVELRIVGEVDVEPGFGPQLIAQSLPAANNIRFYGYVSDEQLNSLVAETSLIFSLRFPSCGETSGPLYKARAFNVPVVLSDYGAFSEESAEYHVSVKKGEQHQRSIEILKDEFQAFNTGRVPSGRATLRPDTEKLTVNQMLDNILIFTDNKGSDHEES